MQRTYIIAEAGVNHNGSVERAKQLIEVAAQAGADAVKFQTFKAEKVISIKAPKADYQTAAVGTSASQLEMVRKLELDEAAHLELVRHCEKHKIQFLSTPFDHDSVDLLVDKLKVPKIKIPSGEVTNAPLLLKVAATGKPVIFSTGMSNLDEIKIALGVLAFGYLTPEAQPTMNSFVKAYESSEGREILKKNVILLHCTTEYPAPFADVNLKAIETMKETFGLPVGYSDHTEGLAIPVAAVARGAVLIEKHFTLDRNLPGPDHKASINPSELKDMVRMIRDVEQAIGSGEKFSAPSEEKNKIVARRSLIALKAIKKGEPFSKTNLTVKRPGSGLSPFLFWEKLGSISDRDYQPDDLIN